MVTFSPSMRPFLLADGERVEQRLGGMLVRAVAGVDDAGIEDAGQEMRRAGRAVADDDEVRVQRLQVARGVLERLALLERGGLGGEIDDVGREPLLGQLEAGARAGGRLDEQVDDRLAAQGGHLLDGALADRLEGARGIEHGGDFLNRERFDVEQMFAIPAHGEEWGGGGLGEWNDGMVEYCGAGNGSRSGCPLPRHSITPSLRLRFISRLRLRPPRPFPSA